MENNPVEILYFLGIGGIGMSALARYFHQTGCLIYGYDLSPTRLTRQLEQEGMHIHYEEDITQIPDHFDKVIFTPAIPEDNIELQYFRNMGAPLSKRSEILGRISRNIFTIAVAGTHGKTSISAMIAYILEEANLPLLAFVGGISKNFNSNIFLSKYPEYLVVEADEYDRSLLELQPDLAVVTSMDADHLDVYNNLEELQKTFLLFAESLSTNGILISHEKLTIFENKFPGRITYGISQQAEIHANNVRIKKGSFLFEVWKRNKFLMDIQMNVPGFHYIENALAAISVALQFEVSPQIIKRALESFSGVERRFDFRIQSRDRIYIDDYGHHPVEIKATLDAVRALYPTKKISAVFQPHLFSRTRDLADGFAEALSNLDQVILLDIYPAREKSIPGITSKIIFDKINVKDKYLLSKRALFQFLEEKKPEVFLSFGAGDIGLLVNEIEEILKGS